MSPALDWHLRILDAVPGCWHGFHNAPVGSRISAGDPRHEGEERLESDSRMLILISPTLQSNQWWGNSGIGLRAMTVTQVGGDTHGIP